MREQGLHDVLVELGIHVVDVRLDELDGILIRGTLLLAHDDPQYIGYVKVFPSETIPRTLDAYGRQPSEALRKRRQNGRSRRCHQFTLDAGRIDEDVLKEL